MAGYSGTPLAKKLGIKEGHRLVLVNAPEGFVEGELEPLPDDVTILRSVRKPVDVAVLFVTERADLERRLPSLDEALDPAGGLWVAWPKKASKVATDMTEQTVRDVGLPRGLVDNKVCAVTDVWSGLRLVIRKENRAARTAASP